MFPNLYLDQRYPSQKGVTPVGVEDYFDSGKVTCNMYGKKDYSKKEDQVIDEDGDEFREAKLPK